MLTILRKALLDLKELALNKLYFIIIIIRNEVVLFYFPPILG
jgi:hypothetical protein